MIYLSKIVWASLLHAPRDTWLSVLVFLQKWIMFMLTDLSHTLYKELLQNNDLFIVLFLPKMSFKYLFIHSSCISENLHEFCIGFASRKS